MRILRGLIGLLLLAGLLAALVPAAPTTYGQANLILNPSFDQGGSGRAGINGPVPTNWELWVAGGIQIDSDMDSYFSHMRTPPSSWLIRRPFAEFTAAGYQRVTVEANKNYTLTAHAYIWTCANENGASCIRGDGTGFSQPESGAVVKVGIDPNGGSDPNAASVIWSPTIAPHPDHPKDARIPFTAVSVTAKATGTTMTVFLHYTATKAMYFGEVHWDDVSLVTTDAQPTSGGTAVPGNPTAVPPPAAEVPFVTAQQARPDGSIVHTVVAGDTISSILFAYRDFTVTREDLMEYNNWRFEPQFITVGQEIVILPPGSIDPATGQIVSGAAPAAATPEPTPDTAAAQSTNPPVTTPDAAATAAPVTTDVAAQPTATQAGVVIVSGVTPVAPTTSNRAAMEVIDNFLPAGSISQ